ncbi:MAG TPA: ankyrin repeat domain-containing protein [Acidimicrobiales bacterium]|nr:ankyrin repeat domain-containing protein [Acidimicrobiales bacterium]
MALLCLPDNPSLEQLKNQARDLQRAVESGDAEARELIESGHPRSTGALSADGKLKLADAQLATARLYGFPSWPRMAEVVEEIVRWTRNPHRVEESADEADEFLRLACLTYGGDDLERHRQAQAMLAAKPELNERGIHAAAAAGNLEVVERLIAADPACVNALGGPFDWEPLLYLCYSRIDDGAGGSRAVRSAGALLRAGADPDAGYLWAGMTSPFTALTGAFGEGEDRHNQPPHQASMALATVLLMHGADPNDAQALYNRSWSRSDEHLELLVARGLGKGDGGPWHKRLGETHQTPKEMVDEELVKAAAMGRANRARLMLEAGADPGARGAHPLHGGRTAYELAVLNGNTEIAAMLESAGAHAPQLAPLEIFVSHCLRHERRGMDELLAKHPELLEDAKRLHPGLLRQAAELGRQMSVRLLVDLGFDINHVERVTALHEAAWRGDVEMARLLIGLGADPTIKDHEHDSTPRGWALHSHHQEVADYLVSVGG